MLAAIALGCACCSADASRPTARTGMVPSSLRDNGNKAGMGDPGTTSSGVQLPMPHLLCKCPESLHFVHQASVTPCAYKQNGEFFMCLHDLEPKKLQRMSLYGLGDAPWCEAKNSFSSSV